MTLTSEAHSWSCSKPTDPVAWIRLVLILIASICVGGCVAGGSFAGLGIFDLERSRPAPEVRRVHLKGFGLASGGGKLALGYVDWTTAVAELDGKSYVARWPGAELAVGKAATRATIVNCDVQLPQGVKLIEGMGNQ